MKVKAKKASKKPEPVIAPVYTSEQWVELLNRKQERCRAELEALVKQGAEARARLAVKITEGALSGALAYEVRWSNGLQEDVRAQWAQTFLNLLDHESIAGDWIKALPLMSEQCDEQMRRTPPCSTNPFSNAIDLLHHEAARHFYDRLKWWGYTLNEYRSNAEVL
jgi:hypothetical protein